MDPTVAESLERRCRPEVVVLHDRRIPGSRANIDHIAVAPSGVWLIDTERYKGAIRIAKPLFGPARLTTDGRDKTKLVAGLRKQVELVAAALPGEAHPVRGVFCFVGAELPLLGTPSIDGLMLLHRRGLAKRLNADGPLDIDEIVPLAAALAARFPPG